MDYGKGSVVACDGWQGVGLNVPALPTAIAGLLLGVVLLQSAAAADREPGGVVGFKNDGSGRFVNCRPPVTWDDASGKNVAWKIPMPSWTASSPIVIDDRVVTLAEPNLVVAVDLATGRELWRRAIDPADLLPESERESAKALYARWASRYVEALATAAELKVLEDLLLCVDGQADKAFAGNFMLNQIDPSLKESALARARKLSDADIAAMRARVEDLRQLAVPGMATPSTRMVWPTGPQAEEWNAGRRALAKYGYQFETWYGHIGHTFATPVSDGRRVYVSMGWGQVAALDLDGSLAWMKWFEPNGSPELRFTNSPLLVDGRLVVIAGGAIRAFDMAAGGVIWEHPCPEPKVSMGQDHAGSPVLMTVAGTRCIVTSHGRIYRAADGRILVQGLPEVVATPAVDGDLLFLSAGGVHGTTGKVKATAHRVRVTDDGERLQVEPVWSRDVGGRAGMWTGPTCVDGLLYYAYPQNVFALDARTGEVPVNYVPNAFNYGSSHAVNPVSAGGHVYTGNCYGQTLVIKAGPQGGVVACNQITSGLYRDHALLPVDELRARWWSKGCFPTWSFSSSTPFFVGRRMVMRTYEHLACMEEREPK